MHVRRFTLALAVYVATGGSAMTAPPASLLPEVAFQENNVSQAVRWRYRRARDDDLNERAAAARDGLVVPGDQNLFGVMEALKRDVQRRRGWIDPPPPR
jgi:hypothetical protein